MTYPNFKEIDNEIKSTYYNSDTNVVKEFLNPVLKRTKVYKRETYSFSSSIFSLMSESLTDIIRNNCRIYYIVGIEINKEDLEAIERGLKDENGLIEREILKEFGRVEELIYRLDEYSQNIYRYRLQVLSYLISKKILQIKIGFVTKNGRIKNPEKFKFHPKVMIFTDFEGNTIVTNGSINESLGALSHNEESFDVFKGWDKGTLEHFNKHVSKFDDFWNNKSDNIQTIEISDLIKERVLTKYKSHFRSQDEIYEMEKKLNRIAQRNKVIQQDEETTSEIESPNEDLDLRDYQKEAISCWFNNGKKGILEMATGTGKTETSIGIFKNLLDGNNVGFCIVAVPSKDLIHQWIDRLQKYGFLSIGASSDFSNWKIDLKKKILDVNNEFEKYAIVVVTYATFGSKDFTQIIEELDYPILLICDEVHHTGAPIYSRGLISKYSYRLGLSATPDRWFDDEGTMIIRNFFDKTVYKFSLKKAINTINPNTGKTFLCQYKYYPSLVDLSAEENKRYLELTKKLQKYYHINRGLVSEKDETFTMLSTRRAEIIKNADSKIPEFEKIIDKLGSKIDHCIIYCSGKQLESIKEILKTKDLMYHEFTQYQKSKKSLRATNLEMSREELLKAFDEGDYKILLAIDCLNEGIDIPSAKIAIFLQSSTNPIEFIQRRGRLLRWPNNKNSDKTMAIIYDLIVIPLLDVMDEDPKLKDIETKVIQKEFNRFAEFALSASNTIEAYQKIKNIMNQYNLIIEREEDDY